MKGKPIDSFDPCEDFFLVVIEAHIVAAAMKMLKMASVNDTPSKEFAPQGDVTWTETAENRKALIDHISSSLIKSFMHLDYKTTSPGATNTEFSRTMLHDSSKFDDGIYTYATNFVNTWLFLHRILRCHQRRRWLKSFTMLQVYATIVFKLWKK